MIWCEIDVGALSENMRAFRRLIGPTPILAPAVKANAYGHGLTLAARAFLEGGADWLCVHSVDEASALRAAQITAPIYVMGPIPLDDLPRAAALEVRAVAYNREMITRLGEAGLKMRLHLKIETGNHRQGLEIPSALALADQIAATPGLTLEGIASHFADIEDTTDHSYARLQLTRFNEAHAALRARGHAPAMRHLSNTAATLLWPDQRMDMVRVGIGAYGLWPSAETRIAAALVGRADPGLRPALIWKTRVGQIKAIPEGAYVGYGRTFQATRPTRLAVLPVGYYDGYDRGLSNLAHVLIRGRRAPLRGRVCMNLIMVDATDIPEVCLEDEVVLLGAQGEAEITAEAMAGWAHSINYEIITRIAAHVPRRATRAPAERPAIEARAYRPPRP
ncbi:alanine racemase [Myxococcota bacterium]|nr:alanine racemase [Myxococcota bacterium]MBU1431156.1 alanine racemase [Myxococcota bacterium]MBU1897487.1 alanine racemase [Myxococcota bacterium]